jgi:hypothetical protein
VFSVILIKKNVKKRSSILHSLVDPPGKRAIKLRLVAQEDVRSLKSHPQTAKQ